MKALGLKSLSRMQSICNLNLKLLNCIKLKKKEVVGISFFSFRPARVHSFVFPYLIDW